MAGLLGPCKVAGEGWKPPTRYCLWLKRTLATSLLLPTFVPQLGAPLLFTTHPALSPGNILGRPSWLPVPEFALMTLLGEGASVVLDVSVGGRGGLDVRAVC